MPSKYYSAEELLEALAAVGLPTALRERGLFESAVAAPQAGFGGHDPYPSLFEKAAALMRSLIANHAFVDGNKRAGLFAALLFLRINGQDFDAPDDLVYDETVAVACGERSVEVIARFLETYAKPFSL